MFVLICEWKTDEMTHSEFHGVFDTLREAQYASGAWGGHGEWDDEDPGEHEWFQKAKLPENGWSVNRIIHEDGSVTDLEGSIKFFIWEYS